MVARVQAGAPSLAQIQSDLRANQSFLNSEKSDTKNSGFSELLQQGIAEVNSTVKASEKASLDLVSGKSTNMHEAMLASSRAELGFNLLVQLRNKALEAYQEVMRMQV